MAIDLNTNIPIDFIKDDFLNARQIELGILRLDQLHSLVSGNKWFKLKENIKEAKRLQCDTILTFGGAYSNHLLATAAATKYFKLDSIGIVRGLDAKTNLNPTLQQCQALGMQLHFINREDYQQKNTPDFINNLQEQYPKTYIIPEGGNNAAGLKGAAEIAQFIPDNFTLVVLPIGTGTTFAGIRNALNPNTAMMGFPVMKGGMYLQEALKTKVSNVQNNWSLNADYHFGGFGKHKPELIGFMIDFYAKYKVPLDFVYTGKMMFGIFDFIKKEQIPKGSKILCIHTGGLQGNRSMQELLPY